MNRGEEMHSSLNQQQDGLLEQMLDDAQGNQFSAIKYV